MTEININLELTIFKVGFVYEINALVEIREVVGWGSLSNIWYIYIITLDYIIFKIMRR
jgi:hypothetical protein